jgi:hypothetical protein
MMPVHFFGLGILVIAFVGVLALLAGAGVLAYFLLRRKQPPRGFDVLPKE